MLRTIPLFAFPAFHHVLIAYYVKLVGDEEPYLVFERTDFTAVLSPLPENLSGKQAPFVLKSADFRRIQAT